MNRVLPYFAIASLFVFTSAVEAKVAMLVCKSPMSPTQTYQLDYDAGTVTFQSSGETRPMSVTDTEISWDHTIAGDHHSSYVLNRYSGEMLMDWWGTPNPEKWACTAEAPKF